MACLRWFKHKFAGVSAGVDLMSAIGSSRGGRYPQSESPSKGAARFPASSDLFGRDYCDFDVAWWIHSENPGWSPVRNKVVDMFDLRLECSLLLRPSW